MMLQKNGVKIWRPRQLYLGEPERDYVNMSDRIISGPLDLTKGPSTVSFSLSLYFKGLGK